MGFLESLNRRRKPPEGQLDQFGVSPRAGCFVGGNGGKSSDALGLLGIGMRKGGHFRLERGEKLKQFGLVLALNRLRGAEALFELADGIVNHGPFPDSSGLL